MILSLKRLLASTEIRLCTIVWSFGFLLVLVAMLALGRITTAFMIPSNLPLLLLGVLLSVLVARVVGWTQRRGTWAAGLVLIVLGLIAGCLMTIMDLLWNALLASTVFPEWKDWALSSDPSQMFVLTLVYGWTLMLSVTLIWGAGTSESARRSEAAAAAFEAAALRAEAAALRLQLNPHLVFNTLNGIASLVVQEKNREAEEMIGRLADFMRASYESDPTAMVALEKELDTVRAYLAIEEARFGDRLRIAIHVDEALRKALLPHFLLQPLVENAVKHGVSHADGAATIEIEANRAADGRIRIVIANRVTGETAASPSAREGIGIPNTRQRLQGIYGAEAEMSAQVEAEQFRVTLHLPQEARSAGGPAAP